MDYNKNFIVVLLIVLFLTGCIPAGGPAIVIHKSTDDSSSQSKSSDLKRTRDDISNEYFAKTKADSCVSDSRCSDICEDLFDDDYGTQDECLKLKIETVEIFEEIVEVLEDPVIGELKSINHKVFAALLALSVEPWVRALRKADRREAEVILAWAAQDKNISGAIYEHGADGDYVGFKSYEGLKELLKAASTEGENDCDKYKSGFQADLNASDFSFCEIAARENNSKVTSNILKDFQDECEWQVVEIENNRCTIN